MRRIIGSGPSPSLVISMAALVVAISGSATALSGRNNVDHDDLRKHVVHGPKIHDGAVGPAKILTGAVRPSHISEGGIRTRHFTAGIEGVAVAGARISEDFEVEAWFNRFGSKPRVVQVGTGHLRITIPGLETTLPPELPIMAALVESNVPAFATYVLGSDGSFDVFTWDAEGRPYWGRGLDIATIDGVPVGP